MDTKEEKKFRLSASMVAMTIPQYAEEKIPWEFLLRTMKDLTEKEEIERWIISQESHKDGKIHLHVGLKKQKKKKFNILDPKHFDLYFGKHGHIHSAWNWNGWVKYCAKEKDFKADIRTTEDAPEVWKDYKRKKLDKLEYEADKDDRKNIGWPIKLFGNTIYAPKNTEKKRHLFFVGKPDLGKTKAINDAFEGMKVWVASSENLYRFEGYNDEEVLIWDDVMPTKGEIIQMAEIYKLKVERIGRCRYYKQYWKIGQCRLIICVNNQKPEFWFEPWFTARFNLINL